MNETRIDEDSTEAHTAGMTRVEGTTSDTTRVEGESSSRGTLAAEFHPGFEFQGCRLIHPVNVESGEATLWKVERVCDARMLALKVYHYGKEPKTEIVDLMARLPREHVVEWVTGGTERGQFYEFLEWIAHGSLVDWVRMGAAESRVRDFLQQMAEALDLLHGLHVIHRDIKPANILVRSLDPMDLVLTDFGISSVASVSMHVTSANRTPLYSAPEAITGVIKSSSDWWSVGVIALELLQGRHPFAGITEFAMTHELVTRGITVPDDLSNEWKIILCGLLTQDPERRWQSEQVKAWLQGRNDIPNYYAKGQQRTESGASAYGGVPLPYKLAGNQYKTPEELAEGLAQNWDEAIKRINRGSVLEWVKQQVKDEDLTSILLDIQEDAQLNQEQKLAIAILAMNLELPLSWSGDVVDKAWLENNPKEARAFLFSSAPGWINKLRQEPVFEQWRDYIQGIDQHIIHAEIGEYDKDLAWKLMFLDLAALQEQAAFIQNTYESAYKTPLRQWLKESALRHWQAVGLLACSKKQLITAEQAEENRLRAVDADRIARREWLKAELEKLRTRKIIHIWVKKFIRFIRKEFKLIPERITKYNTPSQKTFSDYNDVPWIRRAGSLNVFSAVSFILFFFGGASRFIVIFIVMLFPTIVVLTGDVFVNKKNQGGELQKWNRNYKLGPIALCAFALLMIILTLSGVFRG